MNRQRIALLGTLLLGIVLLAACAGEEETEKAPTRAAVTATVEQPASPAAELTDTPIPPAPTDTPAPLPTDTAAPPPPPSTPPPAEPMPTPEVSVSGEVEVCPGGARAVVLVVDPSLLNGIRSGLGQFEADLCNEGYTVVEKRLSFTAPSEVRAYLADLYARTDQRLTGAILIGDLPHAYQWITETYTNPDIPPSSREAISFQYYADLDGVFEASQGYASPAGHPYSYDVHRGDVDWEIWVAVLPLYKGDLTITIDAINRYFAKNHAYRVGSYHLPRAFLQVTEHQTASTAAEHAQILGSLRSGQYAWTPFSNAPEARLYFDSPPGGLSVDQGYADLSAGVADFTVLNAHGTWRTSGKLDIVWVEGNPVRTAFVDLGGCAVGDLDHAENFLTSLLYSPTSTVLVARGTTQESGGMGTNQNGCYGHNMATSMSLGESFGQAFLGHVNVPLIHPWVNSREVHFGLPVILGDPTLRLQP